MREGRSCQVPETLLEALLTWTPRAQHARFCANGGRWGSRLVVHKLVPTTGALALKSLGKPDFQFHMHYLPWRNAVWWH